MSRMNKKGDVVFIMVMVLISILSFFIVLGFLSSTTNVVVSESDDLACNLLISTYDTKTYKVADFFTEINIKCKKDDITLPLG